MFPDSEFAKKKKLLVAILKLQQSLRKL